MLALQGDYREHTLVVRSLGHEAVLVRLPEHLDDLDAIVLPGGESTTMGKLADRFGLLEPLRERIREGLPTLGTCAGMVLLAGSTTEGFEQPLLGVLDVVVRRNAFGPQVESFESRIEVDGLDAPMTAVFIRAPWIEKTGDGVEVLAEIGGHPVVIRQGSIVATSFHPELTGDGRLHQMMLEEA